MANPRPGVAGAKGQDIRPAPRYRPGAMNALRLFLLRWRLAAMAVLLLAMLFKGLVPAGFMLRPETRTFTVAICADASGTHLTREIAVPAKPGEKAPHAAKEQPCAWSALAMAATGPVDSALLALALAFILALGFLAMAPPAPARAAHLRPPLRGPPAIA